MFEKLLEERIAFYTVLHDQTITKRSDARILDLSDEQLFMETIVPSLYIATCLHVFRRVPDRQ